MDDVRTTPSPVTVTRNLPAAFAWPLRKPGTGIVDSAVRTFGIMMGHGTWRYRIDYKDFPP